MKTFIKTKFKKLDDQTNIDIIELDITEYHILSKLIFLRIIITKFTEKMIIELFRFLKGTLLLEE